MENRQSLFLKKGKVSVLYDPRRVGKTELLKHLILKVSGSKYMGTGNNLGIAKQSVERYLDLLEKHSL